MDLSVVLALNTVFATTVERKDIFYMQYEFPSLNSVLSSQYR